MGHRSGILRWLVPVMGFAAMALVVQLTVTSVPAGAASLGTGCTGFDGPFPSGPFALTGCSDRADTGGAGSLDNQTGIVTWANGKTTTISFVLTPVRKDQRGKDRCPSTSAAEFKARGTVDADTTGSIAVGGLVKGELCGRESGYLQNEKGTKFTMR